MTRTLDCLVIEADVGERADVVLGRRIPGLSRRLARALALAGKLRIAGQRRPPSTRVALGERLELELDDELAPGSTLELEPLAITDDFVYVAKPAGVHTVALTPDQPGVLASAVVARWPECAEASDDPREGGAIHRLDFPTSGVVAFARSREVWQRARAGFAEGRIAKLYLAVCHRRADRWPPALPSEGLEGWIAPAQARLDLPNSGVSMGNSRVLSLDPVRIRAPLGRGEVAGRVAVRLEGRRASSVIQPLAESLTDERWLVGVRLETGLRHQARVHLAWIGLPIVGDLDYGGDDRERARTPRAIRLHALMLDLSAVFRTEQPMVAPPDPEFWPASRVDPP
ncbi:pseudouridine synthase [Nannocystaceae bacterium ST9]